MNEVKFSVFSDLHYWPGNFSTDGMACLDKIRDRALENHVDFVIHLGDLCHAPSKYPEIVGYYDGIPLQTYHCIGNHECEWSTYDEVLEAYRMEKGYYCFDRNGFRFLVLDLNNMRIDGQVVHYSMGNYRKPIEGMQLVTFPEEQLAWLEQTIMESPYPCILFSHHSLERANGGLPPAERRAVRELLRRVNRDKQRVLMAVNGHYHRDNLRIMDNIAFFDLNSTSCEWVSPQHFGKYPEEFYNQYRFAHNTVIWEDPIHAIITVREDGTIKIEGMKSRFLYGVDHYSIGLAPEDSDGRPCVAEVLSAQFRLIP